MAELQPVGGEREITAKDVFVRSNMPSRWERLTNVAPKTRARSEVPRVRGRPLPRR